MTEQYEAQFKNWTAPIALQDWKGKDVLDAGCGMGRNSVWPMRYGARSITAFDFDERSVARAKETLRDFPDAHVHYKSIYDIDWESQFDIAFSIGVIHHLRDPKQAVSNMVRALRPNGTLLLWVYSYEGNEWIVRFVDPIRLYVTSKLPPALVHILSYFCSVPLYIFVQLYSGKNGYLRQLSTFAFWHVHSIVFDQLIPDIAHYWKQEEVRELTIGLELDNVDVVAPANGSGWILTAAKHGDIRGGIR